MLDFKRFRRDNKMTQVQAAEYFGFTQAFISQMERGESKIPEDLLDKIKADTSLDKSFLKVNKSNESLESNAVAIENPNVVMIPLVGQYAYAGYLSGYTDTVYLEALPKVPMTVDRELRGSYMIFEVRGDSMEDGSMHSICQGDRLISRQIKQELWQYKLHMNQWNFVIVHKIEGILVKRISNHNIENGVITLHSLNPLYEDFDVNLKDVAQMFNVVEIHRNGRL